MRDTDHRHPRKEGIPKSIDHIAIITSIVVILLVDLTVILSLVPGDRIMGSRIFTSMFSLKATLLIIVDIVIFYLVFSGTRRVAKKLWK